MSNTLDKLKALNEKLEIKLVQQYSTTDNKSSTTKLRQKSVSSTNSNPDDMEAQNSHVELTDTLMKYMDIDITQEPARAENLKRVSRLYKELQIDKKVPDIESLFVYKAMNISGIGIKEDDFGEIRAGKYVQVIAITYEPDKNGKKKAKNISLGYFGRAESLTDEYKNKIIEFVLCWRYEKAFQNLKHYKDLIGNIRPDEDGLF